MTSSSAGARWIRGSRAALVFVLAWQLATTAVAVLPRSAGATLGDVTEFGDTTPGGRPRGIAAGPDGNVWFTEGQGDRIGRMTTDQAKKCLA